MSLIKIAALQLNTVWENRQKNFDRVQELSSRAKDEGAQVLVLPEMFATGFSLDTSVTAEDPKGETHSFLKKLAADLGVYVIGGYVQRRREGTGLNTALSISPAGVTLAEYGKVHLFSFLGEDKVHQAGAGPRPFQIEGVEAACFICYDLRFQGLFGLVAERAHLIFVIASWPKARQHHWNTLLTARAIENQLYIVGVNRVGTGGGIDYAGGSAIIDPQGRTVAQGGDQEEIVIADIDGDLVEQTRREMPFLLDRKY